MEDQGSLQVFVMDVDCLGVGCQIQGRPWVDRIPDDGADGQVGGHGTGDQAQPQRQQQGRYGQSVPSLSGACVSRVRFLLLKVGAY